MQRDVIAIQNYRVECLVGMYAHERTTPQPLEIDLRLHLPCVDEAAQQESLTQSVDYAAIAKQLDFFLQQGHFQLLESAAYVIAKALLWPPSRSESRNAIHHLELTLRKPNALRYPACAQFHLARDAEWAHPTAGQSTLLTLPHLSIRRLDIPPHETLSFPFNPNAMRRLLPLTSGLHIHDQPWPAMRMWQPSRAQSTQPVTLHNPTEHMHSLWCIERCL